MTMCCHFPSKSVGEEAEGVVVSHFAASFATHAHTRTRAYMRKSRTTQAMANSAGKSKGERVLVDDLPDEILVHVFRHLPCGRIEVAIACVSARWRRVARDALAMGRRLCVYGARTMVRASRWCDAAASAGHLDCLVYAHARGHVWATKTTYAASRSGHMACIDHLCRHGCRFNARAGEGAAQGGHVDAVVYLLRRHKAHPASVIYRAVRHARLEVYEAVLDLINGDTIGMDHLPDQVVLMNAAILSGRVDVLAHVLDYRTHVASRARVSLVRDRRDGSASQNEWEGDGHGSFLRSIAARHRIKSCVQTAIKAGQPQMVRLLVDRYTQDSIGNRFMAMLNALYSGNVRTVAYLHEALDVPFVQFHATIAARNGRPDILRYMYERGVRWDGRLADSATYCNHLGVIDFVCTHTNAKSVRPLCVISVLNRNVRCLEYALTHGHDADKTDALARALRADCPVLAKLLLRYGAVLDVRLLRHVACRGECDTVRLLVRHMIDDRSTEPGAVPIVVDMTPVCAGAIENGHVSIARYLLKLDVPRPVTNDNNINNRYTVLPVNRNDMHLRAVAAVCGHADILRCLKNHERQ